MKYTNKNRGVIQDRYQGKRINSFSGIRIKNITPTDIDGFIDYQNNKFVFMEVKYNGTKLPYGQKLALERLCDSCNKDAILIVADHKTLEGDIDVGSCIIREYRYRAEWRTPLRPITVTTAIKKFIGF